MEIKDYAMYNGEVRVFPRKQYEVIQCEGGQPLAVAAFNSEHEAKRYALALNRQRLHGELLEKCHAVLLCAARWAECHANGDAVSAKNIFDCDFDGALELFGRYDEARQKWEEINAD